ncbi:hypothetical protein EV424DRAFT_1394635 [Suillus variegatus]|nr:hypothetical protein EV424DRAFT_1394635 [Suillus variegatus]
MNPLIFTNAFASVHIGVQECFCGKPTVEDHDFCFCSPGCARADSLRTLGGQGDYHYRNVMQRACASPAVPQHALSRHKSEHQLRSVSISKRASVLQQSPRSPKESEPRNESVDTQQSDPPQRTLKRSLPSKPGLNKGVRDSIFAMFRKKIQQTAPPSAKIRRESSVTGAILQEIEEENEEEAAWGGLQDRMEDNSRPPTLVHHQVRQTADTRRSRVIRRSASFAGFNGDRGSVMEVVSQLRQAWNEMTDIMPDFDESSDEEY